MGVAIDQPSPAPPAIPEGAHVAFLALSGVGFIVLVSFLVVYGIFGAQFTAGLDGACAEAALDAGRKLEATGNTNQAIQKYRQALGGVITDEKLRHQCGRSIGDLLFRDKRYDEAVAAYQSLSPEAFASAGAYAGYVTALWRLGEKEEATRLGETWLAAALAEENLEQEVWARNILMRSADAQGDAETALEHGAKLIAMNPADEAGLYCAQILSRQGNLGAALEQAEAFLNATENPALQQSARKLLESLTTEKARVGTS
jgi:tetratricopeptide (TPR) repeat protein